MTDQEEQQTLAWVQSWRRLGPILERLRQESVRRADTAAAIEAFELAYKAARLRCPPRLYSGLVEQQRWFKLAHR